MSPYYIAEKMLSSENWVTKDTQELVIKLIRANLGRSVYMLHPILEGVII